MWRPFVDDNVLPAPHHFQTQNSIDESHNALRSTSSISFVMQPTCDLINYAVCNNSTSATIKEYPMSCKEKSNFDFVSNRLRVFNSGLELYGQRRSQVTTLVPLVLMGRNVGQLQYGYCRHSTTRVWARTSTVVCQMLDASRTRVAGLHAYSFGLKSVSQHHGLHAGMNTELFSAEVSHRKKKFRKFNSRLKYV